MKLEPHRNTHLTYCTNIHPGESWPEVRANLERYATAVKAAVAPERPFGIGLRLSAEAANQLADEEALAEFREFLDGNGLYVFTVNGFPYGRFHGSEIKEKVYLPDWRHEERLRYSNLLADLLAHLLPETPGLYGSVSTVPGGFKPAISSPRAVGEIAATLIRHVAHLVELRRKTGRTIILALEPEPCCFLETIDETADFFEAYLFSPMACTQLAGLCGLAPADAETALRRHIGVCLDLCHAAVEFENPAECLSRLQKSGITIGKVQISAGLRVAPIGDRTVDLLRPFDDGVYLHQVVASGADGLSRFTDLPAAFASQAATGDAEEWRVHFHVPIFLDDLGEFHTTQPFIREIMAHHRREPVSQHLEVETYTWDVLPERYREADVVKAVSRELAWAKEQATA